jgi:hypothetical protein
LIILVTIILSETTKSYLGFGEHYLNRNSKNYLGFGEGSYHEEQQAPSPPLPRQAGTDGIARVDSIARHPSRLVAAIELVREEQVAELGLVVGQERGVGFWGGGRELRFADGGLGQRTESERGTKSE